MWHVVSVSTRQEIETASRINSAGFIAHCPTYIRRRRVWRHGKFSFQQETAALFPGYIFLLHVPSFRKEKFETMRVRLSIFFGATLSEDHMEKINSTALEVAAQQAAGAQRVKIRAGEVMQIIHGVMMGEPVEVLRVSRDTVLVQLKRFAGARPVAINASSLGRAV